MMEEVMWQVTAPHFCAGLVLQRRICVAAAPVLKWAIGSGQMALEGYFGRRRWQWRAVGAGDENATG
jgi:hypothetical protein